MMYVTKPVTVEAYPMIGLTVHGLTKWLDMYDVRYEAVHHPHFGLILITAVADLAVSEGDWIVRDGDRFYVVPRTRFGKEYVPVELAEPDPAPESLVGTQSVDGTPTPAMNVIAEYGWEPVETREGLRP